MKIFHVDFVFKTEFICYDDACHLKKYAKNSVRRNVTRTTQKMDEMEMIVHRFHFKNHVDRWCKGHCNPYNRDDLKVSAITLVISFVSINEATQTIFQVVSK